MLISKPVPNPIDPIRAICRRICFYRCVALALTIAGALAFLVVIPEGDLLLPLPSQFQLPILLPI
jgi:hypothetical protein